MQNNETIKNLLLSCKERVKTRATMGLMFSSSVYLLILAAVTSGLKVFTPIAFFNPLSLLFTYAVLKSIYDLVIPSNPVYFEGSITVSKSFKSYLFLFLHHLLPLHGFYGYLIMKPTTAMALDSLGNLTPSSDLQPKEFLVLSKSIYTELRGSSDVCLLIDTTGGGLFAYKKLHDSEFIVFLSKISRGEKMFAYILSLSLVLLVVFMLFKK